MARREKGKQLKRFTGCLHRGRSSGLTAAKRRFPRTPRNKETQCRNAFARRFYGLLQIPLQDFTANARRTLKRNDKACRGRGRQPQVSISRIREGGRVALLARSYRSNCIERECDIYFPSAKRRNAMRTAIRWCIIDDKGWNNKRERIPVLFRTSIDRIASLLPDSPRYRIIALYNRRDSIKFGSQVPL